MKGSVLMYDYTRNGIERKTRPRTGRKVTRKVISSVLKITLLAILIVMIGAGVYVFTQISGIIRRAPDISSMTLAPTQAAT